MSLTVKKINGQSYIIKITITTTVKDLLKNVAALEKLHP